MVKEYWRPVVGYEGLYEVSSFGRVKSIKFDKEKILKPRKVKVYDRVCLYKDGVPKNFFVHILVAEAFLGPRPDGYEVDHIIPKSKGGTDYATNLQYVTHQKNIAKEKAKKVHQCTLNGVFVKEWESANEIQRETGWRQSHITDCCIGKWKTAYGYTWHYV